ncbi:hypothetical protein RMATCC62417_15813 [Rhizopus microsporus]|nr:hypothetical protein RMATCC62417_15813 [Rhizopus microsporus]
MRPILYPDAEELIRNKKQEKSDKQTEEEARPGGPPAGGRRGKKRKDTPEEKRVKRDARKRRRQEQASSSTSGPICKSCGQHGHSSVVSSMCPNHQFTLKEWLTIDEQEEDDKLERYQRRIIEPSSFLRQVVYRAQIFVNYYILSNSNNIDNLSNNIFDQNF